MALTVVGSKAVIRVLLFIVVVPIAWGGGGLCGVRFMEWF